MKDIISKLSDIENTPDRLGKATKKILKEEKTPKLKSISKNSSFKDVFENMSNMKPLPVVNQAGTDNQKTGTTGFLDIDDNSPSAKAIQAAVSDLAQQNKAQIVLPKAQAGPPNNNSAQNTQTVNQNQQNQNQQNQNQQPLKEVDSIKKVASVYVSLTDDECEAEYEFDEDGDIELIGVYDSNDRNIMDLLTFNELESVRQQVMDSLENNEGKKNQVAQEGKKVDRMVSHIKKSEEKAGKNKKINEGIKEKIKGAIRRELQKDVPLVQTRKDYAWMQAGDAYSKGDKRKGDRYMAWQERSRKKYDDTTTNLEGSYRTKTSDFNESKKPDFLDLGKNDNKKEPMMKAMNNKKKQKVKESMKHKINAARLEGKTHGLRGHAYHGNTYEHIEEKRAYHEGYKEGLDECYMNENMIGKRFIKEGDNQGAAEELEYLAEQIMELTEQAMSVVRGTPEERRAERYWYSQILGAISRDNSYGASSMVTIMDTVAVLNDMESDTKFDEMFESWDKQLKKLINENKKQSKKPLKEGLSVSINRGHSIGQDSVSITATDQDADELLALIKNSGLGIFSDEAVLEPSSAMSLRPQEAGVGLEIEVDDNPVSMIGLMQKLSGIEDAPGNDYEEEYYDYESFGKEEVEDEDSGERKVKEKFNTCVECGKIMETGHSCGSKEVTEESIFLGLINKLNKLAEGEEFDSEGNRLASEESFDSFKEKVIASNDPFEIVHDGLKGLYGDEVLEQLQQYEDEVIRDSEGMLHPDDDHEEIVDRIIEKMNEPEEDNSDEMEIDSDMDFDSEELHEWANKAGKRGTEHAFVQDTEFMTQTIAGGLNKPKSTGQTTIPVIASQTDRQDIGLSDIAKLAGIKK